jgi:hypothetical protein
VRVCALVAVIACGVLAVPATARADPFSTGPQADPAVIEAQGMQQADAAVADAQALVSQELTATSNAVSKAMAKPATVQTSATGIEKEAAKTVSDVLASVGAAPTSATATPPPREQRAPSPPTAQRNRHRSASHRHRSAAPVRPAWAGPAAGVPSSLRATPAAGGTTPRAAERGRGSARQDRGAGSGPHRLPPLPVPQQGLNGSAEAGGSPTPSPLLLGALAAALLFVPFEFLSRLLPRSAFRKPRRLALPPWHPG